jgi:cytochrome c-type protein NapB
MIMKRTAFIAATALTLIAGVALAQEQFFSLRGDTPLAENAMPAQIAKVVNSDIRKARNYPEQPPLIPHQIDNYQIDARANKCLTCHSRSAVEESQAPMISITHFMNRENQFLASVTPRRYFCTQCHVVQSDARDLVNNQFIDVDTVISNIANGSQETD